MKVGLDATPLLGPQTGVGRYVAALAGALATLPGPEPEEVALVPFSWRGTPDLPRVVATLEGGPAPGAGRLRCGRRRVAARRVPARRGRPARPPGGGVAGPVR